MSIGQFVEKLYTSKAQASREALMVTDISAVEPSTLAAMPDCLLEKRVWDHVARHPQVIRVSTDYDPDLNKRAKYDGQGCHFHKEFTETHRQYAEKAKTCSSIKQLQDKVCSFLCGLFLSAEFMHSQLRAQLKNGKKTKQNQYTLVDTALFDGFVCGFLRDFIH